MHIELTPDLESFVRDRVVSGQYPDEAGVLRAAFTLLERSEKLLSHIDEGTDQLRRGEYSEFSEDQQASFIAAIEKASRSKPQNNQSQ